MWHNNCKGLLLATLLTWSTLMCTTVGATTEGQETPLALPVAELTQPTTAIQGEVWEEDDHEVLIRNERGTKSDGMDGKINQLLYKLRYKRDLLTGLSCRYGKNPWTECDTKTNTRSRTLTLKKGDPACDPTRTIQKKCKKGV